MSSDLSERYEVRLHTVLGNGGEHMPLAEQWDDDARREDWPENGDFLTPQKCAAQLRRFAAEHLTEQTEPSAEDWKIARASHVGSGGSCEDEHCWQCYRRAYTSLAGSNATLRRIRELLVGKTKGGDAT